MTDTAMPLTPELLELGEAVGAKLSAQGASVAVAEGSCGGLVSAALLAVPGASRWYRGGALIYTGAAVRAVISPAGIAPPDPIRGASEPFVSWLAESIAAAMGADWGVGEGGATGPDGNPYGDPAGHCWMAVHGPHPRTRHLLTGEADRLGNMARFAAATLRLLRDQLEEA